jgi:hypothetical protein
LVLDSCSADTMFLHYHSFGRKMEAYGWVLASSRSVQSLCAIAKRFLCLGIRRNCYDRFPTGFVHRRRSLLIIHPVYYKPFLFSAGGQVKSNWGGALSIYDSAKFSADYNLQIPRDGLIANIYVYIGGNEQENEYNVCNAVRNVITNGGSLQWD